MLHNRPSFALARRSDFGADTHVATNHFLICEDQKEWEEVTRVEKRWENVRRRWEELRRTEKSWEDVKTVQKGWQELARLDKSWEELRRFERHWEELRRIEKSWQGLRRSNKSWEELRRTEKIWEEAKGVDTNWKKLRRAAASWDGLRRVAKSWERIQKRDEQKWGFTPTPKLVLYSAFQAAGNLRRPPRAGSTCIRATTGYWALWYAIIEACKPTHKISGQVIRRLGMDIKIIKLLSLSSAPNRQVAWRWRRALLILHCLSDCTLVNSSPFFK